MPQASDFLNLKFSFRWGERKQSPEECAKTAAEFLKLVQTAIPGFKKWTQVHDPQHKPVSLAKPTLTKLFLQGRHVPENGAAPVEKLGYKVFLTSSAPALGFLGAYLHCGCYGKGNVNAAVLDVYLTSKRAKSLLSLTRCRKFCEQAVAILQPDEGVLDNLELFKQIGSASSGWIVYLSAQRAGQLPKLPRGVDVRPFKKRGVMLIAADKSFPKVPPDNLKTMQALGKALGARVTLAR